MSAEDIPFIEGMYSQYILPTYNNFNQRLTPQRAALLDYLSNLIGPAALQQWLGAATDDPSFNTSVFAILQELENVICDIESQIRQLASAQLTTVVYTANTILPGATAPASCVACGTTQIATPAYMEGFGIGTGNMNGLINQVTGSPASCMQSVQNYSISSIGSAQIPQPSILPSATPVVAPLFPGFNFSPIGGCSGNAAGALQLVVSGNVPYTDTFLWRLGGDTQPYIGVQRTSGVYYFTANNGTTTTSVPLTAGTAPNLPDYPHHVVWSPGAGAVLTTNSMRQYTLSAAQLPSTSVLLPVHISTGSGLQSLTVGYI